MYARSLAVHRLGILAFALAIAGCPPSPNIPRPPGTDGGARWAFAIAEPVIHGIAPDAELREILGAVVNLDGRIPSNGGDWSFVAWSPTRSTIQVTVSFHGTTSTSQRTDAPPGPGIQVPLPANWADSIAVFAATSGKRDPGATIANLVVLNVASYTEAPGKATWGINFNAGQNQLITATGSYIGPE
ncbi:MAG TPA: hypothetical protein VF516_16645 [Kofleriaceae bacterium]